MKRRALTLLAVLLAAGCRTEVDLERLDPDLNRMLEVPRYDPYEESAHFPDSMTMRRPPEGTVPYQPDPVRAAQRTARTATGLVSTFPVDLSRELIDRGEKAFNRTCSACHGSDGTGNLMVTQHMQRKPPSLHTERIRSLSPGELFTIVTHGYGFMPGFETHLDIEARWAVVAYLKVLQRSQYVPLSQAPDGLRRRIERRLR